MPMLARVKMALIALAAAAAPVTAASTPASAAAACPVLVAHQGYSSAAHSGDLDGDGPVPSNSVAALRDAVSHGARVVEFDARWSADGVPVVIHSGTVDAVTRWHGPVAAYKAATLERMHLVAPRGSGHATAETLPSLATMAAAARAEHVAALVEIKTPNITAAQAAAFVAAAPPGTDVSIHSFYAHDLAMLPQYPRILLSLEPVTAAPGDVGVDLRGSAVTAADVAQMHRAGLVVGAYVTGGSGVADDRAEWSRLAAAGVNSIISGDTPGYVAWARGGCGRR
jgi:glycerophosphoryl diester phosphodiesterase